MFCGAFLHGDTFFPNFDSLKKSWPCYRTLLINISSRLALLEYVTVHIYSLEHTQDVEPEVGRDPHVDHSILRTHKGKVDELKRGGR